MGVSHRGTPKSSKTIGAIDADGVFGQPWIFALLHRKNVGSKIGNVFRVPSGKLT